MRNKTSERNALMELAERMKPQGNKYPFFAVSYEDMDKAQRIVAELAKVKDIKEFGVTHVREDMAIDAIEVCRAIAEEGDGK